MKCEKACIKGRDIINSTGHYKGALMNACVTLKHDPLEDCSVAILHQAAFLCLQLSVNKRSAETSQVIYIKGPPVPEVFNYQEPAIVHARCCNQWNIL